MVSHFLHQSHCKYISPVVSYLYYVMFFYRSQNFLCLSNFFWTSPKIILHLFPLQNSNLLYGNHLLVWHKKYTSKFQIYFYFQRDKITNCFTLMGSSDVLNWVCLLLEAFGTFWNMAGKFEFEFGIGFRFTKRAHHMTL